MEPFLVATLKKLCIMASPGTKKEANGTAHLPESPTVDSKSKRVHRPDHPVHSHKDSLFSTSSGYTNYRGFLNLCILLLVISNARVAIENVLKYGILVDPANWLSPFLSDPYHWPNASLLCCSIVFISLSLLLEKALVTKSIPRSIITLFYALNLITVLVLPAVVVLKVEPSPFSSSFCLGMYCCVFLKLISYKQVNAWCREDWLRKVKAGSAPPISFSPKVSTAQGGMVNYPNNLNAADLTYFMCAPTLCYELNFPRTPRVRRWFLAKRLIESVFLGMLVVGLSEQWILPLLRNAVQPLVDMELGRMLERLLKLCIPNHVIWLICFYCLFHSILNATAEALCFADRVFYLDWWNAETIQEFWQKWNLPCHRWALRHLYKPLMSTGHSRLQASLVVFMVSAFFHEYLVSIPLSMFRLWAFLGMLGQVPLQVLTSKFLDGKWGNMVVWGSLILGQPLCILMYLHDYYVTHYGTDVTAVPFPAGSGTFNTM